MKSTDLCKLNIQPYPYQIKGIEEGIRMKRFINGDECGLGKTLMALATIAISGATPALVICPSSLKINWQREVEKFTKLKALVLTDSVKSTFPYLVKMKMFDVAITNYESLRKYFVLDAPKSFTLKDVVFQPSIKIFKSVILDESHRCFPYNTLISTNVGYIKIGDIVENRLCDILIYSYDFSQKKVTENKIKNYWKNDIGTRKIYRIETNYGEVYATEGHKIYTDAGRFKEIQDIKSGESVLVLRKKVYDKKGRKENESVEFVRVESVEIYQPTDRYESDERIRRNQYVYDLEIERTHNYFANNILVHNCKDAGAQQTKFTRGICKDKEWVIMLTGTPVVNSPMDLATQLAIMGRMQDFGGLSYFKNRYSTGRNLDELNHRIDSLCYFRREKKEVFKDMPKLTRSTVYVELDKCVREEYETCLNDLRQYLAEYRGLTDPEIKKRMRMKALVKFMNLRHISSMGKVMPVISMVRDMNTNVVIFCSHHDIVDQLLLAFPNAVTVTGRDSQNEKQAAVDAFQSREADIIICSIKAAGVGLTLTASSHEIFVEIPWTYADLTQCESREDRIGQKESVNSYITLGKDSIDDRLFKIIMDKRSIASRITGSDDDIPSDERYFEELMSCINESNS